MKNGTLVRHVVEKVSSLVNPMSVYIACKRISKELDLLAKQQIAGANDIYLKLAVNDDKLEFEDRMLKPYTPAARYKYSDKVIKLENELKAVKKTEVEIGKAVRLNPTVDKSKTPLFSVQ